jgi:hypothetical protein
VETRWLSVLYFFIFPAYYPRLFGACESTTRPRKRAPIGTKLAKKIN